MIQKYTYRKLSSPYIPVTSPDHCFKSEYSKSGEHVAKFEYAEAIETKRNNLQEKI